VDKSSTDGFESIRGYLQNNQKTKQKNNDQMKIQSFYRTTAFLKATIQFKEFCLCHTLIIKGLAYIMKES
jgi:hypothetical protein